MIIPPPPNPKELLAAAGLRPKKDWGQNFLREQDVLKAISESCRASEEELVVELGAGLGALTYYLIQDYASVVAVERDRELVPLLKNFFQWAPGLELLEADAGTLDYQGLSSAHDKPLVVVGNLPYQISSRILVSVADAASSVRRCVVMIQKEVAERIIAPPGSKTYGLLSVLMQRAFSGHVVRVVPPHVFLPPPKVHSAVLVLERNEVLRAPEADARMVAAARVAFSARRKTLRNSVAGGLGVKPAQVEEAMVAGNLDPKRRAESFSLDEFEQLGEVLHTHGLLEL